MKKLVAVVCFLCICVAVSVIVFYQESAEGDTLSIYAEKSETEAVLAEMEQTNAAASLEEFGVAVDENTTMPVYYASLLEFAESGKFEYEPFIMQGKQLYISNAVDALGDFAGVMVFNADDIHIYMPTADISKSVDFNLNLDRINSLTEKSAVPAATNAKFIFVEGLGYVYYLENKTDAVLVYAGFKGANGDIFTAENGGIVAVDDELMEHAKHLAETKEANQQQLQALVPDENPMIGSNTPVFIADNSQAGTNTYMPVVIALGVLIAILIIGYIIKKYRRNTK